MILTGSEIKKYVENGDIVIEPFNEDQLNPNSYNYRLGETLTFKEDDGKYRTVTGFIWGIRWKRSAAANARCR